MCVLHTPVLSVFLDYELWVALWYSECVKRKAVYQHGSLVAAACHTCRLLTLFVAFPPVLAALSECMKHDRTCIIIWPLQCYDLLYLARTVFVASTCRGVKLEQHCLQNTENIRTHMHSWKQAPMANTPACVFFCRSCASWDYIFLTSPPQCRIVSCFARCACEAWRLLATKVKWANLCLN